MKSEKEATKKKGTTKNDVIVQISDVEEASVGSSKSFLKNPQLGSSNVELTELESLRCRVQASKLTGAASPETATSTPTPNKPPKIPPQSLIHRKTLARSEFPKPKSRLVEPNIPNDTKLVEEKTTVVNSSPSCKNSPKENLKSVPIKGAEEDEEVYRTVSVKVSEKKVKKMKLLIITERILLVCIMCLVIDSLTVNILKDCVLWGLELWKWSVLVLVIFCGRLFTEWYMNILVFLIERNLLLKKKVLYFVIGMKKSVRVFVWLCLVLLAWVLMFHRGVKRSEETTKILNYITRTLASFLIGTAIWVVKTFLVKLLASSFQCTRFFDRIQESIFHQYIVRTLSGQSSMEVAEKVGTANTAGQLSFKNPKNENKEKKEVIDVEKLKKIKQEKISAWTMKGLINVISGSGLSTISNTLETYADEVGEQKDKEITSEWEAKAAACQIFRNVAKPGSKYIEEEDLLRFMKREEVDNVLPFEGAAETRKIKRSTFKKWVVNVYLERKSLVHSLNDTKTAIEELNKLVSGIVLVVIIIVWLLLMEFLTTKVIVFISSQILVVVFMFGNTAKTVFEAIIFVFVMHPFDVGDRCIIDGVQMVVEEMNILTTVFLRYDNEKIFYPNTVLAMKPISNYYRSPEMSDSVEFAIDVSTSIESIGHLKSRIKAYLESNAMHWRPGFHLVVKEIKNVNKMKMALFVTHTINFQNYREKDNRRSELVLELKKIFEDLSIQYHLLP
ncbi:Mechanosensitive ion channel protein [Melia azedarach]|uniref:Mechanosensitive ion channel protein n=2 Tax=Melia azedarach TaxID=155640 RepID=A0ACC1XDG1_MELAZ|nr:Mechanosensitive ion channel protein [Melia azedarach]KAJ4708808.1 Mechanosensitive ion channel protein [Melia azedarach]